MDAPTTNPEWNSPHLHACATGDEDSTGSGTGEYCEEGFKKGLNPADRDPYTHYRYTGGSSRSWTHSPSGSAEKDTVLKDVPAHRSHDHGG